VCRFRVAHTGCIVQVRAALLEMRPSVRWKVTMAQLFVDPASQAMAAYQQMSPEDPDRSLIQNIALTSQAVWLLRNGAQEARRVVQLVQRTREYPVFVTYNLNGSSVPAYQYWIANIAAAIAPVPCTVILEPDALAEHGSAVTAVLAQAALTLRSAGNTAVYIDAGHPAWQPASHMAALLRSAGISNANGFSLNVSNFRLTTECTAYGNQLSTMTHNSTFVIDTSRNGLGPYDYQTCNPPGRALGQRPRIDPHLGSNPLVNAYLWIKRPGESDGNGPECHGGPRAGAWWQEYAVELARNAGQAAIG
jgi:endoglucanase